jgi:hypothetical protein
VKATELSVAVRVIDRHGVVLDVRVTASESAFFNHVLRSKAGTRADAQFPPELHHMVKDIRQNVRRFLDDVVGDDIVVYCTRGKHDVTLSAVKLRQLVALYKTAGRVQELHI